VLLLAADGVGGFVELPAVPTAAGEFAVPEDRSVLSFFEC
jgi:hypothetical protein